MVNFLSVTKSRLRQNILSYFFTNPTARLYLREIAAILKVDPGNLSKEFNRLEKEGIFVSERRGNQKYFYLNKDYPLYQELKSIIFKTVGVEGRLRPFQKNSGGKRYGKNKTHKS
jgi:predicted transcriptional regulator with HTH domain